MYSYIKIFKYLENLISVKALLLFDYTGPALKNTDKWFLAKSYSLQKKQCLLFKKRRYSGAPTKVGFTIFPWDFVHLFYVAMPKNLCVDFFVLF